MSAAYRFRFTAARGTEERAKPELQLAEVNLFDADDRTLLLSGTVASNPNGHVVNLHQTASKAVDRLVSTKWLDGAFESNGHVSILELHLPSVQAVASYNLWTANDVVWRDPASWSLDMRLSDGTWATIDAQDDVDAPVERLTAYREGGFPVSAQTLALAASGGTELSPPPSPPHWPFPPPLPLTPPSSLPPPLLPSFRPLAVATLVEGQAHVPELVDTHVDTSPQLVDSSLLRAQPASPAHGGAGGAASVAVTLVLVAFVAVATINAAYHWREAIARALRSAIGEEQYAAMHARIETAQAWVVDAVRGEDGPGREAVLSRVAPMTDVTALDSSVLRDAGSNQAAGEADGLHKAFLRGLPAVEDLEADEHDGVIVETPHLPSR